MLIILVVFPLKFVKHTSVDGVHPCVATVSGVENVRTIKLSSAELQLYLSCPKQQACSSGDQVGTHVENKLMVLNSVKPIHYSCSRSTVGSTTCLVWLWHICGDVVGLPGLCTHYCYHHHYHHVKFVYFFIF